MVVSSPLIRRLALQFIAGEDLTAGIAAVRKLNSRGIKGTLNFQGTHVVDESEAAAGVDAAIESLQQVSSQRLDSDISIKLTRIGLDISETFCRSNVRKILDYASHLGLFVMIDMEEFRYVEPTLKIFKEAQQGYGRDTVGIAIQSYLRSCEGYLEELLAQGSRVRLVKGGYWEPDEIIYARPEIDRAFAEDINVAMTRGRYPAIATHDTKFLDLTKSLAAGRRLTSDDFEFQMLYGVREDLQNLMAAQGFTVRSYVPYGKDWYLYFMGCARRATFAKLRSAIV